MKCTAAVVASRGAAPTIEQLDLDEPAPGEIAVRVAATGICRTDLHIRDGGYPVPDFPVIPGHEGAGVVTAIGSAVAGLSVGDHVLIELHQQGRFPVDKIVGRYRFGDIQRAIAGMDALRQVSPEVFSPHNAGRSAAEIAALSAESLHAVLDTANVAY